MAEMPRYFARRPFRYTVDLDLDQGQVTTLAGARNDEVLVRLGYLQLLTAADDKAVVQCGVCGAAFVREHFRERHGDRRHRPRPEGLDASPAGAGLAYADESGDAEERRLEREAPLYWDKTQASQR